MTDTRIRNAGWLLAALTLLNVLNFGDRYLLIAFSPAIYQDLQLTHLQFGLLTGIVFTGVYTVLGLFAGSLADRMHRGRLIAAGLALWSALTAATGLARSFGQMAAARMLIGVGEACLTPAAMSLLAERFAPARRAMAAGIYYMGWPLGVGGSFIFAGIIGPSLGWRGGFLLLGGIGVAAALLVLRLLRDARREGGAAAQSGGASGSFADSFRGLGVELRTNPAFVLTLAGCTIVTFTLGAGILDLLWWVKERGYSAAEAQKVLGLIFLVGGCTGAVLGGVGADWAQRRYAAGRLKFLGTMFLVTAPLVAGYRMVPDHTTLFYALAFVVSVVSLGMFGPALSVVQELVPVQHRASAVALWLLCAALVGAGGGNAAVGWLADTFTAAGYAQPITAAIFVMLGVGALAIPVFFLAARQHAQRIATASAPQPGAA